MHFVIKKISLLNGCSTFRYIMLKVLEPYITWRETNSNSAFTIYRGLLNLKMAMLSSDLNKIQIISVFMSPKLQSLPQKSKKKKVWSYNKFEYWKWCYFTTRFLCIDVMKLIWTMSYINIIQHMNGTLE